MNKEQQKDLQEFATTASAPEIYRQINLDSESPYHGHTQRQLLLLQELVRRDTSESRQYVEKIFMPYLDSSTRTESPLKASMLVCEAMLSFAELQADNDEDKLIKQYDALMQLQLNWDRQSLLGLYAAMGVRLGNMSSRASFDFLQNHQWHDSNSFRAALLRRIVNGLTREEQRAHIKRIVIENHKRFPTDSSLIGANPFLPEFWHLSEMARQSVYHRILIQDEYESIISSSTPRSTSDEIYLRFLRMTIESLESRDPYAEFFSTIESLYKTNDAEGLLELAVGTNSAFMKGNIYEIYIRTKLKQIDLSEAEKLAYLLGDKALRGIRAEPATIMKEQEAFPLPELKMVLEARTRGVILDYGMAAIPTVEEVLRETENSIEKNTDRLPILQATMNSLEQMAQARTRLVEWGALPKELLMGRGNGTGQNNVED